MNEGQSRFYLLDWWRCASSDRQQEYADHHQDGIRHVKLQSGLQYERVLNA